MNYCQNKQIVAASTAGYLPTVHCMVACDGVIISLHVQ